MSLWTWWRCMRLVSKASRMRPAKKLNVTMKTNKIKTVSNTRKKWEAKSSVKVLRTDRFLPGCMAQGCSLQIKGILSHLLAPLAQALFINRHILYLILLHACMAWDNTSWESHQVHFFFYWQEQVSYEKGIGHTQPVNITMWKYSL